MIDAAVRILGAEGPGSVTVRRLAAEAGVAPMSIYNHFGDMHGVFDAVFRRGFAEFADALGESVASDDPLVTLQDMGRRYRSFALDNPDTYAVMFLRVVPGFEPSEDSDLVAASAFGALAAVVTRAIDTGQFISADPAIIAQQIWSTCHGAVALELLGLSKFADPAATYNDLMTTIIRGLLRHPEGSAADA